MKCFYHPDYFLLLPAGHPFPMEKFPEAASIVERECPAAEIIHVEPATMEQLLRVHTAEYLEKIRTDGLITYERNRLGLPHFPDLLERSARETNGTIHAMYAALEDGLACNLAGGTHHAFADRGLGFCVLNDVAVALAELRLTQPNLPVMVIDTDAHQGNGTHALLRNDPHAFTYSIHVGKNYPAAKEPGDCDVPLPRYVEGDTYLHALTSTLPEQFHRATPELVFWIAGADLHSEDRFGQMKLTEEHFDERDRFVLDMVTRWEIPTAVVYGGGYHKGGLTGRIHAETVKRVAEYAS